MSPNCTSTSPAFNPAFAAGDPGLDIAEVHAVFLLPEIRNRAEIRAVTTAATAARCAAAADLAFTVTNATRSVAESSSHDHVIDEIQKLAPRRAR